MEVVPSLDLMGGKVVRLLKGDPRRLVEYSSDPLATAKGWARMGAQRLHVVDLDAALQKGSNLLTILGLIKSLRISIQVGGGLRDLNKASMLLNEGADRVVLGTLAFSDKDALLNLLHRFGNERVVVALDYTKNGVKVGGWRKATGLDVIETLGEFHKLGVKNFLLTAIDRDGTLIGPDFETLNRACQVKNVNIIASGGLKGLDDIVELKRLGVSEVILGRAIYEGLIQLDRAIAVARNG